MGIIQTQASKSTLIFHSKENHSVQGDVNVFRLKGQAFYIFEKENTSPQIAKLAKLISAERCLYLSSYLGNIYGTHDVEVQKNCLCFTQEKNKSTFWSFHNFTLRDEIKKNKEAYYLPNQEKIWTILTSLTEALTILIENGLYIDCNLDNIHFSPLKNYQLYWGNAQVGNCHRLYYRYLLGQMTNQNYLLSPEELKGLKQKKMVARLDLERCVIFNLGIILILYSNNQIDYSKIYEAQIYQYNTAGLVSLIKQCRRRYSEKLINLLLQMTNQSVNKRINFKSLQESIQVLNLGNSCEASDSSKNLPEHQTTCSKITYNNILIP